MFLIATDGAKAMTGGKMERIGLQRINRLTASHYCITYQEALYGKIFHMNDVMQCCQLIKFDLR